MDLIYPFISWFNYFFPLAFSIIFLSLLIILPMAYRKNDELYNRSFEQQERIIQLLTEIRDSLKKEI